MDTASRFRCASVSKMFTVTAAALMVQAGRLDLDAPITAYADWPAESVATARQLSGHLGGIAHYQGEDRIERSRHYESVSQALEVFRNSPRAGPPGADYVYSTHGYTLLSAVVEGAAGRPFLEVLDTEVYGPLELRGSGPDMRSSPHPDMATLYGRRGAAPFAIPRPEDPSYKWAGGGLTSTPTDLVTLASAYYDPDFLDPEFVREMWTSQRTTDGEATGVGIGWRIGTDHFDRAVIHHSGSMGGARSTLVLFPEETAAIAVMTNVVWPSSIREIAELLMEAWRTDRSNAGRGGLTTEGTVAYAGGFNNARDSTSTPTEGELHLEHGDGWISMPGPIAEWTEELAVERMPVRHLRDDLYVLVMPYGLVPLRLEATASGIRGRAQVTGTRSWEFESG